MRFFEKIFAVDISVQDESHIKDSWGRFEVNLCPMLKRFFDQTKIQMLW